MKKQSVFFSKKKQLLLQGGFVLLLLNLLYFAFFFQREHKPFSIQTNLTVSSPTTVWYVYKNKYSEERFFSDRIQLQPNTEHDFDFDIPTKDQIDYIGLFWVAKEKSSIKIASYDYTISGKTYSSKNNRSIIHYTSNGSLITTKKQGVSVQSTTSKRNWIMLNDTTILNDKRDYKKHSLIPLVANGILASLLFVLFLAFKNKIPPLYPVKNIKINIKNIKLFLLIVWAFILPFWVIISHTLLVTLALITLFESYRENQFPKLIKYLKGNVFLIALFVWIVISSIMSSTSAQVMDSLLDYSYLLLMPLVFFNIKKNQMEKIALSFQKGLLIYFCLLLVYAISNFLTQNTDYGFIPFLELKLEQFWHTSYFSFLILIVFIFKIKTPLKNNGFLIVFYFSALVFMYLMHARLPLIVGLLLLVFRMYAYANTAKLRALYLLVVGCFSIGLVVFFLTKAPIQNNSDIGDVNSLDARLSIWEASFKEIKNNFVFGVGSNNTRDAISNSIQDNVNTKFRSYNSHNQFIELFLAHGFPAFLLFIFALYKLFMAKNMYAKCFVFVCVVLFLVESYMQRQAGLVLFAFWYCYFFNLARNDEKAYTS
ncbi:O-antigen ligase family protein [Oceanihabitans sp. 2_MG-2023]|uniref:O-antigen ligase family protein n=1 Tax=Oceanihabitans sp. 2_MG-2023 TaxID=3062661 RepID=UPI0026E11521|nr:O-antigen ligase family protein [Oceanihabitans sp. 2_MG-2023]MDO6595893.1 O-antigen ligase family protein [Oceanihabitans sp. 2_MG-2023]